MRSKPSRPEASNLPKRAVYQLAESVAKQLGYRPGGDIVSALRELGGRIGLKEFGGLGESDSGSLVVHRPGDFDVYVATNTSPTRDRFTIAHELGHYVLHFLWRRHNGTKIERMEATRYGSDRAEWEANWFAAAFLMPEDQFKTAFVSYDNDISRIAEHFGVSPMAAEVRAKALRLG